METEEPVFISSVKIIIIMIASTIKNKFKKMFSLVNKYTNKTSHIITIKILIMT
jgi:hypothetical protein